MSEMVEKVREFHARFGVPDLHSPELPEDRLELREELIREEFNELCAAMRDADLVEVADALMDLIYVTIGAALEFGLPVDELFCEVHRTNMAKVGGKRRADGKILKPDGWKPPNIAGVLEQASALRRQP